jgi:hypothetical protein
LEIFSLPIRQLKREYRNSWRWRLPWVEFLSKIQKEY